MLLLDSGAARTFVHPRMLSDSNMLGWKKLFKTASDSLVQMPMARARIEVGDKQYDLMVAVSDSIELDALLGNDIPDFPQLLIASAQKSCDGVFAVTRAQARKQREDEAQAQQNEAKDEVCPHPLDSSSEGSDPDVDESDSDAELSDSSSEESDPDAELSDSSSEESDPDAEESDLDANTDAEGSTISKPNHQGDRSDPTSNDETTVGSPEEAVGDLCALDSSLFIPAPKVKKKLTRAERRQMRQEFTRVAATKQKHPEAIDRNTLVSLQQADPTLRDVRKQADSGRGPYHWEDGLLVKKKGDMESVTSSLLVLPQACRDEVLRMAHSAPIAGHFGRKRTLSRLRTQFDWPGIKRDVVEVRKSCPRCQKAEPGKRPRAPLQPLPVIDVPFRRIAMDIFGPLRRTKAGNKYVLVIMDYATKWPEAFPLKTADSETVARALIDVFARLGIPREILTDNGSIFTSKMMEKFYAMTGVTHIKTSPYHPETDGMVERFNATMKKTLRKMVDKSADDWDMCLPYLMWAYRGSEHATTGYSPYELVYGRKMRDGLDELAERWREDTTDPVTTIEYLRKLRERMDRVRAAVKENEQKAKTQHKKYYDRCTTTRQFDVGDMVLVFLPKKQNKLLAEWLGPYPITEKTSDVTYEVDMMDRKKRKRTFHVNALKSWNSPVPAVLHVAECGDVEPLTWNEPASEEAPEPVNLTADQQRDLEKLKEEFSDVISDVPGRTTVVEHHIATGDATPIRRPPYRLPHALRETLREEIRELLALGIIRPSTSEWPLQSSLFRRKMGPKGYV